MEKVLITKDRAIRGFFMVSIRGEKAAPEVREAM